MTESDRGDTATSETLLEVRNLTKYFYERDSITDRLLGQDPVAIKAVDGLDFDIGRGETLGLVGESGCGKSTAGETLLRLQEPTEGVVRFDGENIYDLGSGDLTKFRRNAQIVFQDPFSSLDPRMTIGETVRQPLDVHNWPRSDGNVGVEVSVERSDKQLRTARVKELLNRVGLSGDQFDRYPHEFSGGQRQRVGIARALALDPEFVVLDEPTSALDVSVQAQILNLLNELQAEFGLTYLLISHDLSVIRHICDRVAVMYLGEIVEIAPSEEIFTNPRHPYTEALLESVPRVNIDEKDRDIETLTGDVPSPRNPPSGCRFRTRCPKIIPPADVDLSQEEYRAVVTVLDRIRGRELDVEGAREFAAEESDGDVDDATVVDSILTRMLDVDLSDRPTHHERVREAVTAAVEGDWDRAEETLSTYRSLCEKVTPELQPGHTHPAACHLLDQPDDVERAIRDAAAAPDPAND